MLVSALSLIANVYIVSISARCPAIPMSAKTHTMIFKYLARLVCYRTPSGSYDVSCNGNLSRPRCGDLGLTQNKNRHIPDCVSMQFPTKPRRSNNGNICYYYGSANMGEWQAAADVLDRVFLWIFTLLFLVIGIFELTA